MRWPGWTRPARPRVHCGEVTPAELVGAAISRIERLNPQLNAVITPTFDRARGQAAADLPQGPFTGVPYLLKDLAVEDAGVCFTEGSRFLASHVSRHDQGLTRRLRAAGLVICGKTNTPGFGMQPTTEPLLHRPTRNPWDLTRTTGGSSGGSAAAMAAVAAGLVPFAHGNDLGGSIRFPASCCGLFGFKPSRARNAGDVGPTALVAGGAADRRARAGPGWCRRHPVLSGRSAGAGPPVDAPLARHRRG
jgi:amidase